MKQKELKRLSRAELLELLLEQTQEAERLQQLLTLAQEELAQRRLKIDTAGDLAKAVLAVNDVMESAQKAADQYLENIAAMEQETAAKCEAMLEEARQEAQRIRKAAEESNSQTR